MTFETAMEKLGTLQRFGSPGAVERVAWILEQFGNPQHQLQFIHVAGTNGKGSTCAMLSSILREAGYQTGLFVSPYIIAVSYTHLTKFNILYCHISQIARG